MCKLHSLRRLPAIAKPCWSAGTHLQAVDATTPAGSAAASRPSSSSSASRSMKAAVNGTSSVGSTPDSSGSSTQMFDVGSRAGFYTEKSPKLLLHEWCTQQQRPRPKYKAVPTEAEKGGRFRSVVRHQSRVGSTVSLMALSQVQRNSSRSRNNRQAEIQDRLVCQQLLSLV